MDWSSFSIQFLITLPSILLALATLVTAIKTKIKTEELADSVNGHMTDLLEKTKIVAEAVGKKEGIAQEKGSAIPNKRKTDI